MEFWHATQRWAENSMLRENKPDTKRKNIVWFHLHRVQRIVKFIKIENKLWLLKSWGEGWLGSYCLKCIDFQFGKKKKAWRRMIDDCTEIRMNLIYWTLHLKWFKWQITCIFTLKYPNNHEHAWNKWYQLGNRWYKEQKFLELRTIYMYMYIAYIHRSRIARSYNNSV